MFDRFKFSLTAAVLAVASSGACAAVAVPSGWVSITGSLTSFQSALSPYFTDGNGTLDGAPLVIDPNLAGVPYLDGDGTAYPLSQVVSLASGTTSVQFEYTELIGLGSALPNVVRMTPSSGTTVNLGDEFKIATLSYTNGFWYPYARVGLSLTTVSNVAELNGHTFTGSLVVRVSAPEPFFPEPISNADYFYLDGPNGPFTSMGSVRVYERAFQPADNPGYTGQVDLYARIGSLIPTQFANPSGGVFLSPSLDPITAVPEPATWGLMALGLVAMGWRARRTA